MATEVSIVMTDMVEEMHRTEEEGRLKTSLKKRFIVEGTEDLTEEEESRPSFAKERRPYIEVTAEEERRPCIVRVPKFLKRLNEGSYVPQLLGLGPYHHNHINNDPNFNLIAHKRKARENALSRDRPRLKDFCSFVSSRKEEIKAYYSHEFHFDADVFISDAIFIIELTIATSDYLVSDRFHPLLDNNMLSTSVAFVAWTDLLKLENQIPLFLLKYFSSVEELYAALDNSGIFFPIKTDWNVEVMEEDPRPRHLLEFVYCCVVKSMRTSSEAVSSSESGNVHGMGDPGKKKSSIWTSCISKLCLPKRISKLCLPKRKERAGESKTKKEDWAIPAATELHKVGIVFHKSQEQNRLCFKEGRLRLRGHLYLPKLHLDDFSELLFRNVMAFEEFCVKLGQRFFNNYVRLMKHLIHTEADVARLIKHGVIENGLENEQSVAKLFRSICMFRQVHDVPEIREHIVNNVRDYYQNSLRVTLHELIQARFSKPWQIWGSIAAFILLVCTVIQTFNSAKS